MPIAIGGLIILLQAFCLIHAVRNRKDRFWWAIIVMFPVIGSAAYLFLEFAPTKRLEMHAQVIGSKLSRAINPNGPMRARIDDVSACGSVENKIALADECIRMGHFDDAVALYEGCKNGAFADDPLVRYGLGVAYYAQQNYAKAIDELTAVVTHNPQYKLGQAALYRAMALENASQHNEALAQYEKVVPIFSGEEARFRYGALLKQVGRTQEAKQAFEEVLHKAKHAPGNYVREQREWVDAAKNALAG